MPSKRIIILSRQAQAGMRYRAALWADVPSGNQTAYRNPAAISEYANATLAELQAIRDGTVAEKVVEYKAAGASLADMQTNLQGQWTAWQAEVSALTAWGEYGRFWDSGGTAWNASPGVPAIGIKETSLGIASFAALTPASAFGASKFHFVLHNGVPTLSMGVVLKVHLVVVLPGQSAVTGAVSGLWTLRRRDALTTVPSGTGSFATSPMDSVQPLPSGVTCWNAPQVAPAGSGVVVFNEFIPQADEQKLTTLDAPTRSALNDFGGLLVWNRWPIIVRQGQTLEVQQNATAGTGNSRILCLFTLG